MTSPLRVLIVDDAQSLRGLLRALLNQNGYNVVGELEDGGNVLSTVAQLRPDIVCLDLHMPGLDGMSVLQLLKAHHPRVATVMMTADPSPDVYRRATEAGAAGFLAKPFSPKQILAELGQVAAALRLLHKRPVDEFVPDFDIPSARVVIADDSAPLRQLLRAILEDMGLEVVGEASDGRQAIDIARREQPDLVCLDVEMPVLDGLSALATLHDQAFMPPVMMITSRSDRATVQQAAKHGAKGYIVKPYQPEKVKEAISRLLKL